MPIVITEGGLRSGVVRNAVLQAIGGARKIVASNLLAPEGEPVGGLLSQFVNLFGRGIASFTRFAWLVIRKTVFISVSQVFGWLVNSTIQLSNFDWNSTDAELKARSEAQKLGLASIWGSATGSAVGWTAGTALGYGVTMSLPVIGGPALAAHVLSRVVDEGVEEVAASIIGALRASFQYMASSAVRSTYVNARKMIKNYQAGVFALGFGSVVSSDSWVRFIDQWGTDKAPTWTLSSGVEDSTKKLPTTFKAFADGFLDEFFDSFIESGYIIAMTMDDFITQRSAEKSRNPEQGLAVYPDRENPDEKIILSGKQDEIIPLAQNVLANQRTIAGKDVGEIAAVPLFEVVTPQTSIRTLNISFCEYERPPFTRNGKRGKRANFKISDAKSGISFTEMKQRLRAFSHGGIRATQRLDNGRQLAVYAITEQECDDVLERLRKFTPANITRTVYTDVNRGVKPWQRKEPTRLYPVRAVMNYRALNPNGQGYVEASEFIELWRDEPIGRDRFR